jgi:hypothetical protein
MFLFHNRVLQCLACYWGWFCQFVFVGSTVWLPYYYYYLAAIGLTAGGSSVHVHTNNTQNTENGTHVTITRETKQLLGKKQLQGKNREVSWEVRAVPRLCELYPGIYLTTQEKARKPLQLG